MGTRKRRILNKQTVFNDQNAKEYTRRSSPRRNLNPTFGQTENPEAIKQRAAASRAANPTDPTKKPAMGSSATTEPTKPASTGGRSGAAQGKTGGMSRTKVGTAGKAAVNTADDAANASRGRIGTLVDKFKGMFNNSPASKAAATAAETVSKRTFLPPGMGSSLSKAGGAALRIAGLPLTAAQMALYSSDAGANSDVATGAPAQGFRPAGTQAERDEAERKNALEVSQRAQTAAAEQQAAIDQAKAKAGGNPQIGGGGRSPLTSFNAQTGDVRVNGNAGFVDESGVPQDATKTMQSQPFDPNAQFQPGQEGFDGMTKASIGDRLSIERELRGQDEADNLPAWATRNKDLAMKDSTGMRQGIWNDAGKFVGLAADYNQTKPEYKTADLQQRLADQRAQIGAMQDLNLAKGVGTATPYIGSDPANQYKADMAADPTGRTWRARKEASETNLNNAKASAESSMTPAERIAEQRLDLDINKENYRRRKDLADNERQNLERFDTLALDYGKALDAEDTNTASQISNRVFTGFNAADVLDGKGGSNARGQLEFATNQFLTEMQKDGSIFDLFVKKLATSANTTPEDVFSQIKEDPSDLWGLMGGKEFEVEGGIWGIGGQDVEVTKDARMRQVYRDLIAEAKKRKAAKAQIGK